MLTVPTHLSGAGNGAGLRLSLQDRIVHLHHIAERDALGLLLHGVPPQLHQEFLVRFVLQPQLELAMLWQVMFFHGDDLSDDVHPLPIHSQAPQSQQIGVGHWKNMHHLHTARMRRCHGMELRSTVFFAKVGIKPRPVAILLLHFQLWDKERLPAHHRVELLLTALFVFASHLIIHAISFFVRQLPNQLGKHTTLVLGCDLVCLTIDALQQNSHFFGTGQGQLVQTQTENTERENTERKHREKTQREKTQTENTDRKHKEKTYRQKTQTNNTQREKTQTENTERENTERKHREKTQTENTERENTQRKRREHTDREHTDRKHTERKQTHRQKHKKRKHTDRKHTKKNRKKKHTQRKKTHRQRTHKQKTQRENTQKEKHRENTHRQKTQTENTQTENTDKKHTERKHRERKHRERKHKENTEKTQRPATINHTTTTKTPPHHHKNTTASQKHCHTTTSKTCILPQFWASSTHEVTKGHFTTVLSTRRSVFARRVAAQNDKFAFYHSFARSTITFSRKRLRRVLSRKASPLKIVIKVLLKWWLSLKIVIKHCPKFCWSDGCL